MSNLENEFNQAVETITNGPENNTISDDVKLAFYGLYKQAMIGDCNIDKPGFMHFTAKAKWNAWNDLKGMDKDEAKQKYVNLFNEHK